MTNEQLIKELEKHPKDAEVGIRDGNFIFDADSVSFRPEMAQIVIARRL